MTLVSTAGMPLAFAGAAWKPGAGSLLFSNVTLNAALMSIQCIGRIVTSDGGTHTLDNTGSISWRSAAFTWASGSTQVKIGVAAVDASVGPPARAVNVSDTITFDVNGTYTGGAGGITSNAFNTSLMSTGSKSIAHGDEIAACIQMVTRGGADTVLYQGVQASGMAYPNATIFSASTYTVQNHHPNMRINFGDGARGYFFGFLPTISAILSTAWSNASGQKEYGNLIEFNRPVRITGAHLGIAPTGPFDIVMYAAPLTAPTVLRSVSVDENKVGAAAAGAIFVPFSTYYDLAANTPVAIVVQPTSATSVTMTGVTTDTTVGQEAYPDNGYGISRATVSSGTPFAATTTSKDRYFIGLVLGGGDDGSGSGGSGGVSRSRVQTGM